MEPRPPELTVGDAPHPEALDGAHRLGDRGVLDLPQLGRGDLAGGTFRPRLVHGRRVGGRLPTWSARKGGFTWDTSADSCIY